MSARPADLHVEAESRSFYDARFQEGYMDEWPAQKKARIFQVLRELGLPDTGDALDFGCGNGVLTEVVKRALPAWQVYGTDFSAVAIATANARYPGIGFFAPSAPEVTGRQYDLVFTHHVLEHVYDLEAVWAQIASLIRPGGGVLHVLPCGNEGSLEHRICTLRTDGIDPRRGGRFFFEDEGHVRRVGTQGMVELAAKSGLELVEEFYAYQHYGAIDWITASGMDFVRIVTEVDRGKDEEAREELRGMRRLLMRVARARHVVAEFRQRRAAPSKTLKNRVSLLTRLPRFALSRLIDWRATRRSDMEWERKRRDPSGSEMYLYFRKGRPAADR